MPSACPESLVMLSKVESRWVAPAEGAALMACRGPENYEGSELVSLPRFCNTTSLKLRPALLVQRIEGLDAGFGGGANARRVDANHCVLLRAESANAGLVDRKRNRFGRIAYVDAARDCARASGERVAALAATRRVAVVGEHGINQASCS